MHAQRGVTWPSGAAREAGALASPLALRNVCGTEAYMEECTRTGLDLRWWCATKDPGATRRIREARGAMCVL
ncbi:hypothetical protein OBBRIDRAFT_787961 [Obba rivulosa]|uniref:Uncharacterized protein n=1 Tax=Obba rivulosa TaxID=1052685 RepID=A0A8E2DTV3_9APHY|nr:hypothetical protein OBBRIDRAFT_787961 [Obba rivulosa]